MVEIKGKVITFGTLFLVVVSSLLVSIMLSDNSVKMDIGKSDSKFYVNESGKFVLSGVEKNYIYNGSKKLSVYRYGNITTTQDGELITIQRVSNYGKGRFVIDTYVFNSSSDDVKSFPISHTIEVINFSKHIYVYEVSNLAYDGVTMNVVSPASFGHQMNVEWQDGNYYGKVTKLLKSGKLTIKYRVNNDYEKFNVRLFDPPLSVDDIFTNLAENLPYGMATFNITIPGNVNVDVSLLNFSFNEVCGHVNGVQIYNYNDFGNGSGYYVPSTIITKGKNSIKIIADIQDGDCGDNEYGHKIDWIPCFNYNGQDYCQNKWAWWNNTYHDYGPNATYWSSINNGSSTVNINSNGTISAGYAFGRSFSDNNPGTINGGASGNCCIGTIIKTKTMMNLTSIIKHASATPTNWEIYEGSYNPTNTANTCSGGTNGTLLTSGTFSGNLGSPSGGLILKNNTIYSLVTYPSAGSATIRYCTANCPPSTGNTTFVDYVGSQNCGVGNDLQIRQVIGVNFINISLNSTANMFYSKPSNTTYNISAIVINLTASDNNVYVKVCNATFGSCSSWLNKLNNSINITLPSIIKNQTFVINITGITASSTPYVSAFAMTNVTLSGLSNNMYITLNNPANNSNYTRGQNITFNYTVSNDFGYLMNVSLYVNGVLKQTNNSVVNNTKIIYISNFTNATYTWFVNGSTNDTSTNSTIRTFNVYNVNASLCSNISSISFNFNFSNYNISTGKLNELNVNPKNLTICLFNITHFQTINLTARVNQTSSQHNMKCNNISLTTNPVRLLNNTQNSYINCTMDYINATGNYKGQVIFDAI